ncbi:calcium-activated chloride channel regulator 1-like [Lytechinus variegatus]|uniref:calcium-activated chloride channel regulator 1-like n=1 Tax=Lytechinus variegatus TaxID=7654 RepID=UPI001BB0DE2E|nr:calcium-activated chloride channel regulator 1-like [Lytechinus variegatus]
MFTSASQRLYNASRNSVYWKHIKILVPNTWSNLSRFEHSRTESFHSANIIVHHFRDDEPYVENLEGCGKGALSLMHLTPEYILNEQYREDEFGDTGNVLVRSWGYYRWGLFKENYDGKGVGTAPTYESGFTNGDLNNDIPSIEGTRCSLEIKGSLSPSGCTTKPNKKDCHFIPDTEFEQTAKTSLLFATRKDHVPSISEFCDDGSHNIKAPNLMNIHCGKSAWKVMTEDTTDFQHVQGDVERHSDITPVFEVLALSSVRSVVLVLDVSSSMSKVLGPYARGGTIVLLSDGIETESPKIKDTLDNITEAGVIIDTITISNYADQQMEDLSTNTYGTSGFCTDKCTGNNCLTPQFLGTITDRPDVGTGAMPVLILNSEITIKSNPGFHVFPVVIDDALGNNTIITVEWTGSNSILVEVTGPDGTQIDHTDPRYYRGDKIVTITLPQAQNVDHSSKPALAIYVKVEQDYLPVLNATVTAIVSSESSSTTLSLFDNGSEDHEFFV